MGRKKIIKPNKEVVQSYIWSVARYDANAYEKRVLYRMIEAVQWVSEGKPLNKPYPYYQGRNVFKDYVFKFPTSHFLMGDEQNHAKIHQALKSLRERTVTLHNVGDPEKGAYVEYVGFIERPKYGHERGWVEFAIPEGVAEGLLHFTKGFRKYELLTAMNLKSVYSMRFYELFSGQESPIVYTIQELRAMFGLGDKYSRINDFFKRVIIPAKEELDECAPYSFNFKTDQDLARERGETCRKVSWIKFYPVCHRKNKDTDLERVMLKMQSSSSFILDKDVRAYLMEVFEFTEQELRANTETLGGLKLLPDPLLFLSDLRGGARTARSPKAYVIGAIRIEVERQKNNVVFVR